MSDAQMREQAHLIQRAVGGLLQDVKRLGERVGKLRAISDQDEGFGQSKSPMRRDRAAMGERIALSAIWWTAPRTLEKIETAKARGAP